MRSIVLRLVIITLLCYAGVRFWYDRIERQLREHRPAEAAASVKPVEAGAPGLPGASTTGGGEGYEIIVSRNIFHADGAPAGADGSPTGAEAGMEHLAETSLQLSLLGTVSGSQEDARAIIRDEKSRVENLYQVGGLVQGAEIVRISQGRVVLRVQGREEILAIKDPETATASSRSPRQVEGGNFWSPEPEVAPEKVPEAVPGRRFSLRNSPALPEQPEAGEAESLLPPSEQAESGTEEPSPQPGADEADAAGTEQRPF